jgi:hypothetical protein
MEDEGRKERMIGKILSFILFQIAWFAAVLGGAHHLDFVGSCPALALFAFHIASNHRRWFSSCATILLIVLMGIIIELLLLKSGAITYRGSTASTSFPPLWIMALWLAFATLPDGALSWLSGRTELQLIFGALGGPLSYIAGEKLGAAELHTSFTYAMAAFAVAWAIATPLCFLCVKVFETKAESLTAA